MKDSFNGWKTIATLPIQKVADYILTGKKIEDFKPDEWLFNHFGDKNLPLSILDFGCGIGRNTFGAGIYSSEWNITGYDSSEMLKLTNLFSTISYGTENICTNISFVDDWNVLKEKKFDVIFCCIVIQHIYEDDLKSYISDFLKMTKKLVVFGRRFNDDVNKRSNWNILKEAGLTPTCFYEENKLIPFSPEGDPEQHNLAIYLL